MRLIQRRGLGRRAALAAIGLCAATFVHAKFNDGDCNCGERQKVQMTDAGQAVANAALLTWADVGSTANWSGGPKTPEPPSVDNCSDYHPKQADLVRIGSAAADYQHKKTGVLLGSEVAVLQTPEMVRLDLQRTAFSPQLMGCLRSSTPAGLEPGLRLVSIKRRSFPHIGTHTAAWRVVTEDRATKLRFLIDQVVVARGSTEILMTFGSKLSDARALKPIEVQLARTLERRIRA